MSENPFRLTTTRPSLDTLRDRYPFLGKLFGRFDIPLDDKTERRILLDLDDMLGRSSLFIAPEEALAEFGLAGAFMQIRDVRGGSASATGLLVFPMGSVRRFETQLETPTSPEAIDVVDALFGEEMRERLTIASLDPGRPDTLRPLATHPLELLTRHCPDAGATLSSHVLAIHSRLRMGLGKAVDQRAGKDVARRFHGVLDAYVFASAERRMKIRIAALRRSLAPESLKILDRGWMRDMEQYQTLQASRGRVELARASIAAAAALDADPQRMRRALYRHQACEAYPIFSLQILSKLAKEDAEIGAEMSDVAQARKALESHGFVKVAEKDPEPSFSAVIDEGRALAPALADLYAIKPSALARLQGLHLQRTGRLEERGRMGRSWMEKTPDDIRLRNLATFLADSLPPEFMPRTRRDWAIARDAVTVLEDLHRTSSSRGVGRADFISASLRRLRGDWPKMNGLLRDLSTAHDVIRDFNAKILRPLIRDNGQRARMVDEDLRHLAPFDITRDSLADIARSSRLWHQELDRRHQAVMERYPDGVDANCVWPALIGTLTARNGLQLREITSEADLIRQGMLERHCVGGYASRVLGGSNIVFSIEDPTAPPDSRIVSTVAFHLVGEEWLLEQNRAAENENPPKAAVEAAREALAKVRKACKDASIQTNYREGLSEPRRTYSRGRNILTEGSAPGDIAFVREMFETFHNRYRTRSRRTDWNVLVSEVRSHVEDLVEKAEAQMKAARNRWALVGEDHDLREEMSP
jgi:hypothetical protein